MTLILVLFTSIVFSYEMWVEKKEPYYKPGEIVPTPVPVEIVKRVL